MDGWRRDGLSWFFFSLLLQSHWRLHDLISSSMPHRVITLSRVNDVWRFECVQTTSNHGGVGPWHLHRPQINPAFQVWFLSLVRVIIPCSMQPHGFSHRKSSSPEPLYHTLSLSKSQFYSALWSFSGTAACSPWGWLLLLTQGLTIYPAWPWICNPASASWVLGLQVCTRLNSKSTL